MLSPGERFALQDLHNAIAQEDPNKTMVVRGVRWYISSGHFQKRSLRLLIWRGVVKEKHIGKRIFGFRDTKKGAR